MKYFHLNTELFGFHCRKLQLEPPVEVPCPTPSISEVSVTTLQCLAGRKRYKEKLRNPMFQS